VVGVWGNEGWVVKARLKGGLTGGKAAGFCRDEIGVGVWVMTDNMRRCDFLVFVYIADLIFCAISFYIKQTRWGICGGQGRISWGNWGIHGLPKVSLPHGRFRADRLQGSQRPVPPWIPHVVRAW
jgi:hypothetical protein